MFDTNTQGGIGKSISYRARLMSELAGKLAQQDKEDAKLQEHLLEKAPEELRAWLTDNTVLMSLFQYGQCRAKIAFNDDYGFWYFAGANAKLVALKRAWKDIVIIKIGHPNSQGMSVDFSVVM